MVLELVVVSRMGVVSGLDTKGVIRVSGSVDIGKDDSTYEGDGRIYRSLFVTYAIDSPVGDHVAYAVSGG